eukprot:866069-Pleurochrysis_carterae.AAC.1
MDAKTCERTTVASIGEVLAQVPPEKKRLAGKKTQRKDGMRHGSTIRHRESVNTAYKRRNDLIFDN